MESLGSLTPQELAQFDNTVDFNRWKKGVFRWISTTQATDPLNQTFDFVQDDWLGYTTSDGAKIELEKLGGDVLYVPGTTDILNEPYPSHLRSLDDNSVLSVSKHIIINAIAFRAYDAKIDGSAFQTAAVNTALTTSLATQNQIIVQSQFLNAMPVTWIPNWFRPKFYVNDNNILSSYENTFKFTGAGSNMQKADYGIGEPLPYCIEVNRYFPTSINKIRVDAICGQQVRVGADNYIKRYPLVCSASIYYAE